MKTMKRLLIVGILCRLSIPAWSDSTADAILAKADAIRMPGGDNIIDTLIVSQKPDGVVEKTGYEVWLKGTEKTIIKTMSPAADRGTSILMLGHDLWVFLPTVSKPVRVSLQQRLAGEVSNGDLARVNFVADYTPSILDAKPDHYLLLLQAKSDDVTYGSVRLWVERPSCRPRKAVFYAASGRILKMGAYQAYKSFDGVMRPSKLVFTDAVIKNQVSTIYYDKITPRSDLADKYFTKDYLKKLKY